MGYKGVEGSDQSPQRNLNCVSKKSLKERKGVGHQRGNGSRVQYQEKVMEGALKKNGAADQGATWGLRQEGPFQTAPPGMMAIREKEERLTRRLKKKLGELKKERNNMYSRG